MGGGNHIVSFNTFSIKYLKFSDRLLCSATVVSPWHIIAAAHCFYNKFTQTMVSKLDFSHFGILLIEEF
jgi:V8-like Glu-specific endopeptidase